MSNPSNYRGITLINTFAKLFSLVIRKRVNSWCEEQNLLNEFQFGFRDKRGTADCIFVLHTLIQKILEKKSKLYCAFIDYEKAFDTIIHDAMWIKLINAGLSSKIITIIKAIYNKISASVKLSRDISSCFDICLGLKQGEPLSPLLFVLFVNDIYSYLNSEDESPSINGIDIDRMCFFILMFADDMVLFSESPDELQTLLDNLHRYTTDWGLKINTAKTKVLIFQKRRQHLTRSWKLNNVVLDVVDSFCYLGLKINYTGNVEFSTKALSDQALRAANGLLALFKRLSFDIKTKLSLFDSLVTPILLYGAEVWGIYNINSIDKIHIKYCKAILGVRQQTPNYAVFGELGRYPLSIICKERALKFWIKILKCGNSTYPIFHVFRHQVNELTLHPHG
ncbi:MAG: reverse transcriptase family protein, partial [Candidatus Thiodiazotropha sp.]